VFFQVDDKLHCNPKVMAMIEAEGFARAAQALGLWTLCGALARDAGLDGVITLGQAAKAAMDRSGARRAAAMLVRYQLWHAPGHDCEICPQPPQNAWVFHDWFQFGYGTGEEEKTAVAKRKELRRPAVVEAVWARDTAPDGQARCRYCGRRVQRKQGRGGDRRSVLVGTLDHVDPTRAIGASNIVVACSECNQKKAQRTPEQAGMTLQPPPGRPAETAPINTEINTAINPESIHEVSPPRARGGARAGGAWVGPGSPPGSGSGDAAGRAGAAPVVPVAAPWGSPWKGHAGPPPPAELVEEATCPEHNLPEPCRKCTARAREAST